MIKSLFIYSITFALVNSSVTTSKATPEEDVSTRWEQKLNQLGVRDVTYIEDTFLDDSDTGPVSEFDPRELRDPKNFLSRVPVVIWVNIATQKTGKLAQSAIVYQNGIEKFRTAISSGKDGHSTATGYFYGDSVEIDHYSKKFKAWMPFSLFWYRGYATHQAPVGTEHAIGSRASHGCVRMPKESAKAIYELGLKLGRGPIPKFSRRGRELGGEESVPVRVIVIVENRPTARF